MNKKKILVLGLVGIISLGLLVGCSDMNNNDDKQAEQTEQIQQQSSNKLGMPNIKNFYEKQTLKTIMEECDKANLITYAYVKSEMTGKFEYLGEAMGYGVPYSTEYTNPEYATWHSSSAYVTLPQADPNGLYKASGVAATWLMLIDPSTKQPKPIYIEENVTVSQFKLPKTVCDPTTLPSDY